MKKSREEILQSCRPGYGTTVQGTRLATQCAILDVLLDIRDLLDALAALDTGAKTDG